jgi:hypothetical protein
MGEAMSVILIFFGCLAGLVGCGGAMFADLSRHSFPESQKSDWALVIAVFTTSAVLILGGVIIGIIDFITK